MITQTPGPFRVEVVTGGFRLKGSLYVSREIAEQQLSIYNAAPAMLEVLKAIVDVTAEDIDSKGDHDDAVTLTAELVRHIASIVAQAEGKD